MTGCDGNHGINGVISIADGTETNDVSNVNGSISIGAKAHVAGAHVGNIEGAIPISYQGDNPPN